MAAPPRVAPTACSCGAGLGAAGACGGGGGGGAADILVFVLYLGPDMPTAPVKKRSKVRFGLPR